MNYRARLYVTRYECLAWFQLLAFCCWYRGGIVAPATMLEEP